MSEHRQGAASGPSKHPTILEEAEGDTNTRHGIVINIEGPNDWKPNLAIRDFPTNAFGNIEFDGCLSLGSKFVRLAADTEIELVRRLYCKVRHSTVLYCTVLYRCGGWWWTTGRCSAPGRGSPSASSEARRTSSWRAASSRRSRSGVEHLSSVRESVTSAAGWAGGRAEGD